MISYFNDTYIYLSYFSLYMEKSVEFSSSLIIWLEDFIVTFCRANTSHPPDGSTLNRLYMKIHFQVTTLSLIISTYVHEAVLNNSAIICLIINWVTSHLLNYFIVIIFTTSYGIKYSISSHIV